ncbi:hypothetical protein FRC00_014319 [Tulasnella sp. 408]|nr:hypothetical protein FRC00_014319 [Tulasnella sp. 408]
MVTTRGRLAAQSGPPQEGRDSKSSETSKGESTIVLTPFVCRVDRAVAANREGKARRTNKPKFEDAPASTSSSSRGKRKTEDTDGLAKARGKGAGGRLRGMANLPIELFAEVCSYLGPFDLRQLALTNRRMRDFLMNKEAQRIWKMALSSVADLPQCPTDLNEPKAATLVEPKLIGSGVCVSAKHASTSILSYIYHYGQARSGVYINGKHFYVDVIHPIVEKYKSIDGRNAGERVAEYTKELAEQSKDRALTGAGMLKWHLHEMDLQAKQATARKNARFESVKVKLVEAGWDLIDIPSLDSREFRDLVYKDQQLTPKIWQNIKPKLEPLLRKKRDQRLEQERQNRRWKREQAVFSLYCQTAHDILSLPPGPWNVLSFIPDQGSITSLPRVQGMLEADTETITKEKWLEVEDEVGTLIRRHWVIILRKVLSVIETGRAPPAGIPASPNEEETDQEVIDHIVAIRAKLAIVTASFVCKSDYCKEIHWFPGVLLHGYSRNPAEDLSGLLRACEPLDPEKKKLVTHMLDDLGLDRESATEADAKHYIQAQRWYFFVKQAKQIRSHPHTVIDDHDWLSNKSPLIRQHDEAERASLEFSQTVFRTQATTDPTCDSQGVGGEDFRLNIADREIIRCCKLCPHDMGPLKGIRTEAITLQRARAQLEKAFTHENYAE